MKAAIALLLCLPATAVAALPHAAARQPVRPIGDCLRVDRVTEWHVVDARTVIVRTGPKRYRLDLAASCPWLGLGPAGLWLRPNASHQELGIPSLCGESGETIASSQQPPCAVRQLSVIDRASFDRLAAHARRGGSAADQGVPTPARP